MKPIFNRCATRFFITCLGIGIFSITHPTDAAEPKSLKWDFNESIERAAKDQKKLYDSSPTYRARVEADKLVKQKRYSEAIEIYRDLIKKTPDDQTLYVALGTALYSNDQPTEAIPLFDKAVALNKRSKNWVWFPYMHKGQALMRLARFDDAAESFGLAIKHNPTDSLYLARANAYFMTAKFDQAIRDTDSVIAQNPRSAKAWTVKSAYIFERIRYTKDASGAPSGCEAAKKACDLKDCRVWQQVETYCSGLTQQKQ